MGWCGLLLDQERDMEAVATEACGSPDGVAIQVYVYPVDEGASSLWVLFDFSSKAAELHKITTGYIRRIGRHFQRTVRPCVGR